LISQPVELEAPARCILPAYHARQGSALRASTTAGGAGLCLGVLHGRESGLPTTSRQDAGAVKPLATSDVMQINEARLNFQLVHFDADDRLATTQQLLRYLTAGLPDMAPESFWIVAMNPNRRPICRTRIKTGVLVACQCLIPDVFLALLLAEAKSFACLRTQPEGVARPNLADGRLLWNLKETAKLMNIEFVDYFIARSGSGTYYSWREHDRNVA
jgi:DNA repair protein RadC